MTFAAARNTWHGMAWHNHAMPARVMPARTVESAAPVCVSMLMSSRVMLPHLLRVSN